MPKTYAIEGTIGNNQFTYQLYNNIKPSIESNSELNVILVAASNEALFASFSVQGAEILASQEQHCFLSFPLSYQCAFSIETLPTVEGGEEGVALFVSENNISPNINPNGNYELKIDGLVFKLYKDGILLGSLTAPSEINFVTTYTLDNSEGVGASIFNVVLGT